MNNYLIFGLLVSQRNCITETVLAFLPICDVHPNATDYGKKCRVGTERSE